jgi:anti-sigma regulatory factor (Ser/Thr protein kinase)
LKKEQPLFTMLSLSVLRSDSTVAVRLLNRLSSVLKLLKMVNFPNAELTDMVLLYGEALGNAVEARRRIPDSRTFSATVQRLRDQ